MKPSSQDYDGGRAPGRARRTSPLNGRPAAVSGERLPARSRTGVGGQADLRYCQCGGKKRDGKCVRGCEPA